MAHSHEEEATDQQPARNEYTQDRLMTRTTAAAPAPAADGNKPSTSTTIRILIAGDSITHGHEGDYTWRYRLWEWLEHQQQQNTSFSYEFVGPYTGVDAPLAILPPAPPAPTESPVSFVLTPDYPGSGPFRIHWGYAEEVDEKFNAHHFSTSGYQVNLAQQVVERRVREYEPDVVLVLLGYNDLSWSCKNFSKQFTCVDPDRAEIVLQDMQKFVENARAGSKKKGLKFAVGNVVHRTSFREDVTVNTEIYNKLLEGKVKNEWGIEGSPVHLVDVAGGYSCGPGGKAGGEGCPAAFDGLHPNFLGEYEIAASFAKVLVEEMDVGLQGAALLRIPEKSTLPTKDLSPPRKEDMRAEGSPMGVTLTWDRRYGIVSYDCAQRRVARKGEKEYEWETYRRFYNRTDIIAPAPNISYEFKLRACYGMDCPGAWSESISAISTRETAPPPTNIQTRSTPNGFQISWSPPETGHQKWNISQYEFGHTYPHWPMWTSIGSLGHNGTVTGLLKGEIRSIRVATWTEPEGGSVYSYGRPIIVGGGVPGLLKGLKVKRTSKTSVEASWEEASGAAGYLVQLSIFGEGEAEKKKKKIEIAYNTSQVLSLPAGPHPLRGGGQHSICITPVNGDLESDAVCTLIGQPRWAVFPAQDGYTRSFSYWGAVFPLALLLWTWLLSKKLKRRGDGYGDVEAIALK